MNTLDYYNSLLDEESARQAKLAAAAKSRGDERTHSVCRMKESMLKNMLKILGRVSYEGKRPHVLENLIDSLMEESEAERKRGDYDASDRAEQKAITVRFAMDALEEAKRHGT